VIIPEEYTIQKFFQLAGYPKQKHNGRIIEGGCPVCKEGKSWGRKRRLYFMVNDNHIFCHNCGWSGNPINFIKEVDGLSYNQILDEAREYDVLPDSVDKEEYKPRETVDHTLPKDSINVYDTGQIEYYMDDGNVMGVRELAKKRGLFTAVNKPKTLWVSVTDFIHKNRLVIPFYDSANQIVFYQSRTVFKNEKLPKYLSKVGADKTLFNINNVTDDIDSIFIFEGPIDACFVKNGIAVAGIQENSDTSMTQAQQDQLKQFGLWDKIWALDSQWQDNAAKLKTKKLADQGHSVFIWPEKYGKQFKDFNDMAVALDTNEIPYKFILDNTYTGLKAQVVLGQIR
jgi:hypothetical protein